MSDLVEFEKVINLDEQEWDEVIAQSSKKTEKIFKMQIYWLVIIKALANVKGCTQDQLMKDAIMALVNSSPENAAIVQKLVDAIRSKRLTLDIAAGAMR